MATGALTVLGMILSLLFWLLQRSAAKKADPVIQNQNRYADIDKQIAKRDGVAASIGATADLDLLDRLQDASGSHKS